MKEALVILILLLVLAGLTAYRYRKGLMAMLTIWRTLQSIRQTGRPEKKRIQDEP